MAVASPDVEQPQFILVEPQLADNLGAAARAMANFGLADLRLVNPRPDWRSDRARAAASGADGILDRAHVYASFPEAIADLGAVYATTARPRGVAKDVIGPRAAVAAARTVALARGKVGFAFGRERIGLTNDEVALCTAILTLPVDPEFPSLNLAHAVLVVAYEWRQSGLAAEAEGLPFRAELPPPAEKAELVALFEHLEAALDETGFFRPAENREHMVLALRAMLQRANLTVQDVRTLRGVIAALERRPTRPRVLPDGRVTTTRGER
jgi:tRNA/rRNA methyltransferase